MSDKNGEECWYALKVFYNRVFELEKQLSQEGVRSYIPLLHEDHRRQGTKRYRKRKPAFRPCVHPPKRTLSARIAGPDESELSVHGLLRPGNEKTGSHSGPGNGAVHADHFRRHLRPGIFQRRSDRLPFRATRSGVTGGPFKGAEGYIKRIRGNRRLVVALEGIIAVATTYIPGRFLEKMPEN